MLRVVFLFSIFLGAGRWAQSVFSPAKADDVLKAHSCLCFASASGRQGPAQNGSVPRGEYIIPLSVLQLSYDPRRVTPFCRGKQAQRSSRTCMKSCRQEVAEWTLEPGLANLCCFFQP